MANLNSVLIFNFEITSYLKKNTLPSRAHVLIRNRQPVIVGID